MAANIKNADSFKVEYYPEPDGVTVILIRAGGAEGLEKAKARAKNLSKTTKDIAYAIASDAAGTPIGQIVYSEGRISSRAGCFE